MTDRDPSNEPTPRPRSRLEDEVLEILVRADQPTSLADQVRRRAHLRPMPRRAARRRVLPDLSRLGPGSYLIGSLVVAVLAAMVRGGSPLLATLLAVASVAFLAMMWVRRYTPGSGVKRWRGHDIDLTPPPPAWVESLRDCFRRPPRL